MPFTITKPNFSNSDLARVDPRILKYLSGWKLVEQDRDSPVTIPDYIPINYFEDLDKGGDSSQFEKQLVIFCGWASRSDGVNIDGYYDSECIITLGIFGPTAADINVTANVSVQIKRDGGDPMILYYNGKQITDFTSIGEVYAIVNGAIQLVIARYWNGYQVGTMNTF